MIETYDPAGGLQLYNLDNDLGEATNLAGENTELADQLLHELDAWRRDVGADVMRPNPDYDPAVESPKKGKKKAKPRVPE